ncbi:MAG: hypothetical protein JNM20_09645 [Rhizobiales bacterium]|nr:hypothetical protein [Hyphomicrobiales bacterium]
MSKATPFPGLTPARCDEIQAEMLEACRKVVAGHGLAVESLGWQRLEAGISFVPAFRVSIARPDGKPVNLEKEIFAMAAEHFGLKPTDLDREFIDRGERYRIVGIDPRRPKYPISVERMSDRRTYKFPAGEVVRLLKG